MCSPARCRQCGRTTWSGCGQHVDQVMRNVPRDQQCTCDRNAPKASTASKAPKGEGQGGFLSRVLGR